MPQNSRASAVLFWALRSRHHGCASDTNQSMSMLCPDINQCQCCAPKCIRTSDQRDLQTARFTHGTKHIGINFPCTMMWDGRRCKSSFIILNMHWPHTAQSQASLRQHYLVALTMSSPEQTLLIYMCFLVKSRNSFKLNKAKKSTT